MKKTISFEWGSEKRIKISRAGRRNSLFYESYRQAMAGVAEIVLASNEYTGAGNTVPLVSYQPDYQDGGPFQPQTSDYYPKNDKTFYNYPNNLIVFSGERGTGKSSALLTFVDGLKRRAPEMFSEAFINDMIRCELPNGLARSVRTLFDDTHFCSIPPIDPTTLPGRHRILTVILSRIYHMAEDAWDVNEGRYGGNGRDKQEYINRRDELLSLFSVCQKHINIVSKGGSGDEEIDELALLDTVGDTVCLKQELAELVEKVLRFCYPNTENAFLIIQIDDSDMNMKCAYEILEDMRKYFMVPRVIIIMAADLNHLSLLVEKSFCKSKKQGKEMREVARNLANQYITKLFPATRQIRLPSLNVYLKEHSENTEIENFVLGQKILPDGNGAYVDSQDQIFRLIFRKTGMIFLRTRGRLHYMIPDNMRLLSHLLAMLSQMDDVAEPDGEDYGLFIDAKSSAKEIRTHIGRLRTRLDNVQRLRDYFIGVWVKNALSPEHTKIIEKLDRTNADQKVSYISEELAEGTEVPVATKYSELLARLDTMDEQTGDTALWKFHFAIRQYFSFLGHSLALQELVMYYEAAEKGTNKLYEGCALLSLYPIFGSDTFLIPDKTLNNKIGWTVPVEVTKQNSKGRSGKEGNTKKWDSKEDPSDRIVSYLITMLTEYEPQYGNSVDRSANLNYSVANCLYVKKGNPVSENSRRAFRGVGYTIADKTSLQWEKLQSSSLMAMTNWDVMKRIRYAAEKVAEDADQDDLRVVKGGAENLTDLLSKLNDYYIRLGDMFNVRSQSPTEKAYKYPIQCLESMSFSNWVTPLVYMALGLTRPAEASGGDGISDLTDIESPVFKFFRATKNEKENNKSGNTEGSN